MPGLQRLAFNGLALIIVGRIVQASWSLHDGLGSGVKVSVSFRFSGLGFMVYCLGFLSYKP